MNNIHDMGGMHGFGPIEVEADEPVFHAAWERRAFALSLAAPSPWSGDADRFAIENQHPVSYLEQSYYEKWFHGLEQMLVAHRLISKEELEAGVAHTDANPSVKPLTAENVGQFVFHPEPQNLPVTGGPRFAVGAEVCTRNINPHGHTRLPRYARGRQGTIDRVHGAQVFPDASARGAEQSPQWVYAVAFSAAELWGGDGHANDTIYLDLWEDYLLDALASAGQSGA